MGCKASKPVQGSLPPSSYAASSKDVWGWKRNDLSARQMEASVHTKAPAGVLLPASAGPAGMVESPRSESTNAIGVMSMGMRTRRPGTGDRKSTSMRTPRRAYGAAAEAANRKSATVVPIIPEIEDGLGSVSDPGSSSEIFQLSTERADTRRTFTARMTHRSGNAEALPQPVTREDSWRTLDDRVSCCSDDESWTRKPGTVGSVLRERSMSEPLTHSHGIAKLRGRLNSRRTAFVTEHIASGDLERRVRQYQNAVISPFDTKIRTKNRKLLAVHGPEENTKSSGIVLCIPKVAKDDITDVIQDYMVNAPDEARRRKRFLRFRRWWQKRKEAKQVREVTSLLQYEKRKNIITVRSTNTQMLANALDKQLEGAYLQQLEVSYKNSRNLLRKNVDRKRHKGTTGLTEPFIGEENEATRDYAHLSAIRRLSFDVGNRKYCEKVWEATNSRELIKKYKSCHGTRVLVVEEEKKTMDLLVSMLLRIGCVVTTAVTADECMKAVHGNAFDIILIDCLVTMVNGYALAKHIRLRSSFNKTVPIIGMSSFFDDAVDKHDIALMTMRRWRANPAFAPRTVCKLKLFAAGMNGYLHRPPQVEALYKTVQVWKAGPSLENVINATTTISSLSPNGSAKSPLFSSARNIPRSILSPVKKEPAAPVFTPSPRTNGGRCSPTPSVMTTNSFTTNATLASSASGDVAGSPSTPGSPEEANSPLSSQLANTSLSSAQFIVPCRIDKPIIDFDLLERKFACRGRMLQCLHAFDMEVADIQQHLWEHWKTKNATAACRVSQRLQTMSETIEAVSLFQTVEALTCAFQRITNRQGEDDSVEARRSYDIMYNIMASYVRAAVHELNVVQVFLRREVFPYEKGLISGATPYVFRADPDHSVRSAN